MALLLEKVKENIPEMSTCQEVHQELIARTVRKEIEYKLHAYSQL